MTITARIVGIVLTLGVCLGTAAIMRLMFHQTEVVSVLVALALLIIILHDDLKYGE